RWTESRLTSVGYGVARLMESARRTAPRGAGRGPRRAEGGIRGEAETGAPPRIRHPAGTYARVSPSGRPSARGGEWRRAVRCLHSARRPIVGASGGGDHAPAFRQGSRFGRSVSDARAGGRRRSRLCAVLPARIAARRGEGSLTSRRLPAVLII